MKLNITFMVLSGMALSASAQMMDVTARQTMLSAVTSKSGYAKQEVKGELRDLIAQQINAPNARVVMEAKVIGTLEQKGCKRLSVRYTTPGTLLPTTDGKSRPLDVGFEINMCDTGLPPGVKDEAELLERMRAPQN